jgi:hypothetical protein
MVFKLPTAHQSVLIKFIKSSVQDTRLLLTIILITIYVVSSKAQTYKEVKIGNQIWMADNLNVFHFRNGDPIPVVKSGEDWKLAGQNRQPACCFYSNDGEVGGVCGVLYNWYAVHDKRGIAPSGWHVPSIDDLQMLIDHLGGREDAVIKMKSTAGWTQYLGDIECINCKQWTQIKKASSVCSICNDSRKILKQISGVGTNSSGFSALPGGLRLFDGFFYDIGNRGFWWLSVETNSSYAKYWSLTFNNDPFNIFDRQKLDGLAVRCIKD